MLASLVSLLACSKAAALRPTDAPRTTHQAATRRQSFAAAAATLLVPTAAIAATAAVTQGRARERRHDVYRRWSREPAERRVGPFGRDDL